VFSHERSDLSHWRKRLGDKLELLLASAPDIGAWRTRDLERVTVNTKVSYDARLRKIGSPRLLA
jgi:IS5 family transposase